MPDIFSPVLKRPVIVDVFLPPAYFLTRDTYPLLVLNDGQAADEVKLKSSLSRLVRQKQMSEIVVIAIYAGDRLKEYGVAGEADFRKRGNKAAEYTHFLIHELLPLVQSSFRIDWHSGINAIAGYSLGGLSAFDVGWNHPEIFQRVGVFSGSFWWRSKSYTEGYDDRKDRIAHNLVRNSEFKAGLKFWFETGTHDEHADRNVNGVIDSIDDTLDLISELVKKGYRPYHDIEYLEIKGGYHHEKTWAKAMPSFLKWAYGREGVAE